MDAFYASVEQRDDPDLRGQAGDRRRAPHAAGWCWRRRTRCGRSACAARCRWSRPPAGRRRPSSSRRGPRPTPRPARRCSPSWRAVTPLIEPLSLDEAFLDVTASRALFGAPADIARELRRRIRDETRLPASAGIAGVKFVAKIASDLAKPNGQKRGRRRTRPGRSWRRCPSGGCGAWARRPRRRWRRWGCGRSATWRRAIPTGWNGACRAAAQLWELRQGIDDRARWSPTSGQEHRRRGHVRRGSREARAGAAPSTPRRCGWGGGCARPA